MEKNYLLKIKKKYIFKKNNITIIVFNLNNKKEYEELNQIIYPESKEISSINFMKIK